MKELYFINVLSNLNEYLKAIFILSLISFILCGIIYIIHKSEDDLSEGMKKNIKRMCKVSIIAGFVSVSISTFIPPKNDMYAIYGVGKTIDYLQESPQAKELPENIIKALNEWVVNSSEKEEKK